MHSRLFLVLAAAASVAMSASAAPMLRLTNSAIGPISVTASGSAQAPLVEAYNAGDGALSLSAQITGTGVAVNIGAPTACKTTTLATTCIPIQISVNASGMPASTTPYTSAVTIMSPNTVDAPQTITVTMAVGGTVPSNVSVYVAPGSTQDVSFTTNSMIIGQTKTNDGDSWLSLALQGTGSFRFVLPYYIHVAPQANQTSGTYSGTITTSGSSFALDNKTIAVTMQVTSQPIAAPSTNQLNVTLAQGAPAVTQYVTVQNAGQGTLTIQGVSSSAQGATGSVVSGLAAVKFDPTSLSPGSYTGNLTINSNAANGTLTIPINFTVENKGAPSIPYQGVVDDAIFAAGDAVAPGDIVALFGDQLFFSAGTVGSGTPLSTTIGTTQVSVNGSPAPLFYASYGQINFQVPTSVSPGVAQVQVTRDGLQSNIVSLNIAGRAPRLLQIGVGTYGAILNTDYSIPMPVGSFPGVNTHPAHVGDTLTIYAIGLGTTTASVAAGATAPSSPLPALVSTPTVYFGDFVSTAAAPLYAGFSPGSIGLYQVNVTIPDGVPTGNVDLRITFPDGTYSNAVQIAVQ